MLRESAPFVVVARLEETRILTRSRHQEPRMRTFIAAVAFAVFAVAVGGGGDRRKAADDASHTTTIGSGAFNYTGADEDSVVAKVESASPSDDKLAIRMYVTPRAGKERLSFVIEAPRNGKPGPFDAEAAMPLGE